MIVANLLKNVSVSAGRRLALHHLPTQRTCACGTPERRAGHLLTRAPGMIERLTRHHAKHWQAGPDMTAARPRREVERRVHR
jgi:hypothetical protein